MIVKGTLNRVNLEESWMEIDTHRYDTTDLMAATYV